MPSLEDMKFEYVWQTVLFCLGIFAFSHVIRRACEGFKPQLKINLVWKDAVLPTLPVIMGMLIGMFAVKYPYPDSIKSFSARVFFGGVCGFFSAWVYKVVRTILKKRLGVDLPTDSVVISSSSPPPPPTP